MTEHPGGRPWTSPGTSPGAPPTWPATGHGTPGWGPPAGKPPPGYGPAPGYPPPGYGPPPGYPPPGFPPRRGTDGFAVAALILGILAIVPLAVIFGLIALGRTATPGGQSGRGMAIAGLALSGLWTAVIAVAIVVAVLTTAERDGAGQITAGGSVSATDLTEGDCLNGLGGAVTSILSLPAVPCSAPHEGEVYAVFDLSAGDYPGAAAVDEQVDTGCFERLDGYAPSAAADPSIGVFFVYPQEANWRLGDREVVCIATTQTPATGSLRGR